MASSKVNNDGGGYTKSEKAQKTAVVKEIHQIKIRLQAAESEKATRLYSKKSDFLRDFGQLQEMDNKIQSDLKIERTKLVQQANKIRAQVRNFHRELREVRPTPEFVEKLKVIMEDIESQIAKFKEQQRIEYEELLNGERLTGQEIAALEQRFESWTSIPAIGLQKKGKPVAAPSSHRDILKDLPPEVAAFERFLVQTGGPRGGWDEYDHGAFLKYRNRHKGKTSFVQEAIHSLPTKTEEEVIQHERWYQEYLRLNDLKKSAIQHWKEQKELEKEEVADVVEEVDREEQQKQLKEETKQKIIEQERLGRRCQLNAWKVEKELERAMAEDAQRRQQLEKGRAAEKERLRQEQMRVEVLAMKAAREAEKQERQIEQELVKQLEIEEKRHQAQEEITRFQKRDLQKLKSKVEERKAKEQAEKDKEQRMAQLKEQIGVQVERDPSRLLRPTQGWQERQKDKSVSGGPVLHMPHRAIPSWRAGLS